MNLKRCIRMEPESPGPVHDNYGKYVRYVRTLYVHLLLCHLIVVLAACHLNIESVTYYL